MDNNTDSISHGGQISRRDFLKMGAGTAGTLMITEMYPAIVSAEERLTQTETEYLYQQLYQNFEQKGFDTRTTYGSVESLGINVAPPNGLVDSLQEIVTKNGSTELTLPQNLMVEVEFMDIEPSQSQTFLVDLVLNKNSDGYVWMAGTSPQGIDGTSLQPGFTDQNKSSLYYASLKSTVEKEILEHDGVRVTKSQVFPGGTINESLGELRNHWMGMLYLEQIVGLNNKLDEAVSPNAEDFKDMIDAEFIALVSPNVDLIDSAIQAMKDPKSLIAIKTTTTMRADGSTIQEAIIEIDTQNVTDPMLSVNEVLRIKSSSTRKLNEDKELEVSGEFTVVQDASLHDSEVLTVPGLAQSVYAVHLNNLQGES